MMRRSTTVLALLLSGLLFARASAHAANMAWPPYAPTADRPLPVRSISVATFARDVCAAIRERAVSNGLPPDFIARLIATESRFDPSAVSPAGAQGIAQFMPGTAQLRGLDDPFDAATALAASIDYLGDLRIRFGNLGLAAIAYNAGEGGAARFLAGRGLPYETENYVARITGRPAEEWSDVTAHHPIPPIDQALNFNQACPHYVERPRGLAATVPSAPRKPWGVLISENFSRSVAIRAYDRQRSLHPDLFKDRAAMIVTSRNRSLGRRLRYSARIGADSHLEAQKTCFALRDRGVPCLVRKTF